MKLTTEQLAEWKALVPKLIDDSSDHIDVANSTDMPPQHTVNFRHAKNAHEAAWAITNLIADLEEATEQIVGWKKEWQRENDALNQAEAELADVRKQLAEAQARNSVLANAIGFAKRALDLQAAPPPSTVMKAESQIETMKEAGRVVRAALCVEPTDALDAAIAEAVEPYRKDAERYLKTLIAVRHALQLANDTPNGGITDTLWMPDGTETIFDFIDAAKGDSE